MCSLAALARQTYVMQQRAMSPLTIALLVAVCLAGGVHGRADAVFEDSFEPNPTLGMDDDVTIVTYLQNGENGMESDIPETATTMRVRPQLSAPGWIGKETERTCSNGERVYICPDLPCTVNTCPAHYECIDVLCGGCSFQCKPIPLQTFVAPSLSPKPKSRPQLNAPASVVQSPVRQRQTQPPPPPPVQRPIQIRVQISNQPQYQSPIQDAAKAASQPPVQQAIRPPRAVSPSPSPLPEPLLRFTVDDDGPTCMPGYMWVKRLKQCAMCTPGFFSKAGAKCVPCPEDQYAARSAAAYCNECTGASSTWGKIAQTGCLMTPNP